MLAVAPQMRYWPKLNSAIGTMTPSNSRSADFWLPSSSRKGRWHLEYRFYLQRINNQFLLQVDQRHDRGHCVPGDRRVGIEIANNLYIRRVYANLFLRFP